MQQSVYDSPDWQPFRAAVLARDNGRCTVGRFLGGRCHATLDVHHLTPVAEGGAPFDLDNAITACHRHHPQVESIRRAILRRREVRVPPCRHRHYYPHVRQECYERRLRKALERAAA